MPVRLSSGSHKNKTHELRPTTARTLESVFAMLAEDIAEKRALDLFAGVGSYGVMALRHDAALGVFVDKAHDAEKRITRAVTQYHLEERAMIFREDVSHFLHKTERWAEPFDLIFADPPYALYTPGPVIEEILASGLLAPQGVLIFEHSKHHAPPEFPSLSLRKSRVFGETTVSIWDRVELRV
jgi:16S rRNA (guanine(966)-N(2))-methyltransferase RsmD